MNHPLVANLRKEGMVGGVYIGRKDGVPYHYGNPFTHRRGTLASIIMPSREAAVAAFRHWIQGTAWEDVEPDRRKWILDHLQDLKGKRLLCFCAPESCHGDVLAEMANSYDPKPDEKPSDGSETV